MNDRSGTKIVIKGGLGNQLFQFALLIYIANSNMKVRFIGEPHKLFLIFSTKAVNNFHKSFYFTNKIKYYIFYVKNSLKFIVQKSKIMVKLLKKLKFYFTKICDIIHFSNHKRNFKDNLMIEETSISNNLINIKLLQANNNITLDGYWQNIYYPNMTRALLIKFLDKKRIKKTNAKYFKLMSSFNIEKSVAVHIRGADYIGTKKFDILNSAYYSSAFSKFEDALYFFFFDDIDQLHKMVPYIPVNSILVSNDTKSDIDDFILMMRFRNYILANSTFSWWASFLSETRNKNIIIPSEFFYKSENKLINDDMVVIKV